MPWIETGGVSFHYRLEGSHGHSLVFLHEIGGSLDSWDGVVPELALRFRVLRYDQRGFGLSEKPRPVYGIETLTDDLQNLLRGARSSTAMAHCLPGGIQHDRIEPVPTRSGRRCFARVLQSGAGR